MQNKKQKITTILLVAVAVLLSACANNQSGSLDSSSRIVDTNSTKPIAQCNEIKGSQINAKLKAYVDSANNIRMDYVNARITAIPSTFKDDKSYISMWKWLASPSGSPYIDGTALQFILLNPSTGLALTDWKSALRWSDVASAASTMGITDAQTFFNSVNIVVNLKDSNGEYDALNISLYDASTNKATSQTDGLLPLFYADPAHYAFEANGASRATVLQNLHPFKNLLGQGYTSAQFLSMSQSLCF